MGGHRHDRTLTLDANVVSYYFQFSKSQTLPRNLRVRSMTDFCCHVVDEYPIAWNEFIRAEYQRVVGIVTTKNWLAIRLRSGLVTEVARTPLPDEVKNRLRDEYGFDCTSRDLTYLETCLNTLLKHLVTEDKKHFHRPHRKRNRQTMPAFLKRKLSICICTIDQCCAELLRS